MNQYWTVCNNYWTPLLNLQTMRTTPSKTQQWWDMRTMLGPGDSKWFWLAVATSFLLHIPAVVIPMPPKINIDSKKSNVLEEIILICLIPKLSTRVYGCLWISMDVYGLWYLCFIGNGNSHGLRRRLLLLCWVTWCSAFGSRDPGKKWRTESTGWASPFLLCHDRCNGVYLYIYIIYIMYMCLACTYIYIYIHITPMTNVICI